MPAEMPDPSRTAVVTMELQRGVVGDLASMPPLAEAVRRRGILPACGRLLDAARGCGVPVVHATVQWRADRRGTPLVTPLTRALARDPAQVAEGTAAVELVAELGRTDDDLVSVRHHGLTPFTGTDLDPLLRSLGVDSVVAVGVSLNVGIPGLCFSATDLGYRVTVARDAVVGVPEDYGDEVLDHTLSAVATICSVDDITAAWGRTGA